MELQQWKLEITNLYNYNILTSVIANYMKKGLNVTNPQFNVENQFCQTCPMVLHYNVQI